MTLCPRPLERVVCGFYSLVRGTYRGPLFEKAHYSFLFFNKGARGDLLKGKRL